MLLTVTFILDEKSGLQNNKVKVIKGTIRESELRETSESSSGPILKILDR